MYVDTEDLRPPTALRSPRPDRAQLTGGALTALVTPGALILAAAIAGAAGAALGGAVDRPASEEMEVIEAEFVRLGKPLDPHQLPDREVPPKATAPDDKVVVSEDPQEPKEAPPDAGVEPPAHAEVDDVLRNLSARAHKFAEIAEERELEGSPDGIPEGTAEKATAGSMLGVFFRKGWDVPNTIGDSELRSLVAHARVRFGDDLTVEEFELERKSDNPEFDRSVLDQLRRLQRDGATVPDAPDDPADRYRGATVVARFRGKDAR
ncbi:MAG: hypothetical protein ACODAU_08650 [Myxococcota bacterium]